MLAANWQSLHDSYRKLTMAIFFWILSIVAWWQPKIDHRCIIHAENFVAEIFLTGNNGKFKPLLYSIGICKENCMKLSGRNFFWNWYKFCCRNFFWQEILENVNLYCMVLEYSKILHEVEWQKILSKLVYWQKIKANMKSWGADNQKLIIAALYIQ